MRDKWEGSFTETNLASWPAKFSHLGPHNYDVMARLTRGSAKSIYMSCWHVSDVESAAMWDIYEREGRAIAVRSTWGKVKENVAPLATTQVYGGFVRYIDYRVDAIPDDNVLAPFMHKRQSFSHEREARFLTIANTYDPTASVPRSERINEFPPGPVVALPADLSAIFEAVYTAPESPPWVFGLVQKLLARYGLDVQVRQSDLERGPIT